MRKFVVTLMASLLSCSAAFAFWPDAAASSLEIGVGYRQDKLEWQTFGSPDSSYSYGDYYDYYGAGSYDNTDNGPGVRSVLKWKNLNIWQIEARGKYVTCDNIYLRASGDYGWVVNGRNTDTDYITNGDENYYDSYSYGCNDETEFAKSHSKVKGHVYDARLAIGYQFKMCDDSFSISPLIGYSWHGQHLEDRHLKQNIYLDGQTLTVEDDYYYDTYGSYYDYGSYYGYGDDCSCSSYSSCGNHSHYNTRWNGPFIGFDFDYSLGCGCENAWELFGTYEFHWARFNGKGHWNLRTDLLDGFRQHAKNAYGHNFDIGVKWDFCECWSVAVRGQFQWWWAHHGRDRAKIAQAELGDIKTDCYVSIPLRHVKWNSYGISVDLGMVF